MLNAGPAAFCPAGHALGVVPGYAWHGAAVHCTVLFSNTCYRFPPVHLQALSYTSIGILAIFTAELVAKLLVFGITYFTHSK